jgi:hypothetical protein
MTIADADGLNQLPPWSVGVPKAAVSRHPLTDDDPAADHIGGVLRLPEHR